MIAAIYAATLYLVYPQLHRWVLFHAFRIEDHPPGAIAVSLIAIAITAYPVARLPDDLYGFVSACIHYTFYFPLFAVAPYFSPTLMMSTSGALVVASSWTLTATGLAFPSHRFIGTTKHFSRATIIAFVSCASIACTAACIIAFRGMMATRVVFDLYEQRSRYRDAVGPASYLLHWQMVVLSPMLLYFGLQQRRVGLIALSLAGCVAVFQITGFKMAPTALVLVAIVTAVPSTMSWVTNKRLIGLAFLAALFACIVIDMVAGQPIVSPYIVDRNMLAHGVINMMVIEEYDAKPYALWSGSFLRSFGDPVYAEDPFLLLGRSYFGRSVRANTNFFGDGFINLGAAGVIASTLATGLVVGVSSLLFNRHHQSLAVLMIPIALAIINAPVQVALLTNGLALLWVVLLLLRPAPRWAS